jgi:hypothetical protein
MYAQGLCRAPERLPDVTGQQHRGPAWVAGRPTFALDHEGLTAVIDFSRAADKASRKDCAEQASIALPPPGCPYSIDDETINAILFHFIAGHTSFL